MSKTLKLLFALGMMALPLQPAQAEPVYEFVRTCKEEPLGHCFFRIQERLSYLNREAVRRICLPRAFGATFVHSVSIPVSLLEHVRLGLSAARFGEAGDDVDDVIAKIVGTIYHCG